MQDRPLAWQKAVQRVHIQNGVGIVGSDAHYRPGQPRSTAHSAMVRLSHELKPSFVAMNGDGTDFPGISKHPSMGWENRPSVEAELEVCAERLGEFEDLVCPLFWPLGNHDMRFETYLAKAAPQYADVKGFSLRDHFPVWIACWMIEVNPHLGPGTCRIKHRWKGGTHARHNNTLQAGCTLVTGHLHAAGITPWTDYNGTRYGVDTGCIAVPYDEQFINYTEASPVNWRSAITVLTWLDSQLLPPEQLLVIDEQRRLTCFRGVVCEED